MFEKMDILNEKKENISVFIIPANLMLINVKMSLDVRLIDMLNN